MTNRDILIRILTQGDSSGVSDVGQSLDQLADKADRVGKSLSVKVTAPLVGFGTIAAKFAADANESMAKLEAVFGDRTDAINQWIADLRDTVPATTKELQDLTSGIQDLLVPMGLADDEAERMTKGIVQLAADLASFNNVPIAEALQRIRSGLVGQYEPLLAFGVALNATTVKAEAFRRGIGDGERQLTASERALVSYDLILQGTSKAHGDAARTADSAANSWKFLKSEVQEAATIVGQQLIPVLQPMVTGLKNAAKEAQNLDPALIKAGVAVGAFAASIGPALIATAALIKSYRTIVTVAPLAAAGVGTLTAAIASFATGVAIGTAIDKLTGFSDAIGEYVEAQSELRNTIENNAAVRTSALMREAQQIRSMEDLEAVRTKAYATRKAITRDLHQALDEGNSETAAALKLQIDQINRIIAGFRERIRNNFEVLEVEQEIVETKDEELEVTEEIIKLTDEQIAKQAAVLEMRRIENAILKARISGNDSEVESLKRQRNELRLISRYKALGFSDEDAARMAREDAELTAQAAAAQERRNRARREGIDLLKEENAELERLKAGYRSEDFITAGGDRTTRYFDNRGRVVGREDALLSEGQPVSNAPTAGAAASVAPVAQAVAGVSLNVEPVVAAVEQMASRLQRSIDQLASRINEVGN